MPPVRLGTGISLTTLAFLVLLFSLWQSWLYPHRRAIDSPARPRAETARRIKRGLLADLLGWFWRCSVFRLWRDPCLFRPPPDPWCSGGQPADHRDGNRGRPWKRSGTLRPLGLLFLWLLQRFTAPTDRRALEGLPGGRARTDLAGAV